MYRLAYFYPDEGGAAEDVETAAAQQAAGVQLPDGMADFLKKSGIDPTEIDEKTAKLMLPIWKSRGEEARNASAQRKLKQELEAKLQAKQQRRLKEILPDLPDEDKEVVESWIASSEKSAATRQSLELVAAAGIPMTQDILDLVDAGPEATKAFIKAIGNGKAHDSIDIDKQVADAVARITGVGADQVKLKQDGTQQPQDVLTKYRGERTRNHELLDALKSSASKNQMIKE